MKNLWKYLSTLGLMLVAFLCLGVGLKASDVSFGAMGPAGENQQVVTTDEKACVYIANGKHEMKGGTIGGKAYGIYISGGTFTMSGGTISNCSSYGVYLSSGTFNYSSGTISDEIYLSSSKYITLTKAPTSTLKIVSSSTAVGTKIAKLSGITTIDTSKLSVSGLPTGRKLEIQTISNEKWVVIATVVIKYYNLTIELGDGVGTFSYNNSSFTSKTFSVAEGTTIKCSTSSTQGTITFGTDTVTFNPNTEIYSLSYFQTGGSKLTQTTMTGDMTITPYGDRSGFIITFKTPYSDAYWWTGTDDNRQKITEFAYPTNTGMGSFVVYYTSNPLYVRFMIPGGTAQNIYLYCGSHTYVDLKIMGSLANNSLTVVSFGEDFTIEAVFTDSFIANGQVSVEQERELKKTKDGVATLTEIDYTIRRKQRASK